MAKDFKGMHSNTQPGSEVGYIINERGALHHFRAIRRLAEVVGTVYGEQYGVEHTVRLDCPGSYTSRTLTGLIMEFSADPDFLTTPWGNFKFRLPIRADRLFGPQDFLAKLAEAGVRLQLAYSRGAVSYYNVAAVGDIELPVAKTHHSLHSHDVPEFQAIWARLVEQTAA